VYYNLSQNKYLALGHGAKQIDGGKFPRYMTIFSSDAVPPEEFEVF